MEALEDVERLELLTPPEVPPRGLAVRPDDDPPLLLTPGEEVAREPPEEEPPLERAVPPVYPDPAPPRVYPLPFTMLPFPDVLGDTTMGRGW